MVAEALLSRLEKVRNTGRGTWIACCPAHGDKSPSLTVKEADDGRVLLHCFAGCAAGEVLGAVGLRFDDLFPEPLYQRAKPLRRPFPAADVLEAVAAESLIVAIEAGRMANGIPLTENDRKRLIVAAGRIQEARRMANG